MREKTAQEVYDELSEEGKYNVVEIDCDVIKKIYDVSIGNADYIEYLLKQEVINWGIIYTLYYDVLRELCNALVLLDGIKISNHQGIFAYVCVKFPELELDWDFFENVRTVRNRNMYEGKEIAKQNWKEIRVQMRLYISTISKVINKNLKK